MEREPTGQAVASGSGPWIAPEPAPERAAAAWSEDRWMTAYLRARGLEGRLYPDELVARLPAVSDGHPLAGEWRARAESASRLLGYLRALGRPLAVLDAGCGNGWLASRIAEIPGTRVVGVDVNDTELGQATRVFAGRPELGFVRGNVLTMPPPPEPLDVVVLASVVQYVPDVPGLLRRLVPWLVVGGEIHVLDSPFYRAVDAAAARERTRRHYAGLGVPEMAEVYHHHRFDELAAFSPTFLYRPEAWTSRLGRRILGRPRSPFPWIRIRRERAR